MLDLLALIPAFPLLGFAVLFVTAGLLPKRWITTIGVGSVGISAILALIVMVAFLGAPQPYTKSSGPGSPSPASRRISASTSTRCRA